MSEEIVVASMSMLFGRKASLHRAHETEMGGQRWLHTVSVRQNQEAITNSLKIHIESLWHD